MSILYKKMQFFWTIYRRSGNFRVLFFGVINFRVLIFATAGSVTLIIRRRQIFARKIFATCASGENFLTANISRSTVVCFHHYTSYIYIYDLPVPTQQYAVCVQVKAYVQFVKPFHLITVQNNVFIHSQLFFDDWPFLDEFRELVQAIFAEKNAILTLCFTPSPLPITSHHKSYD